MYTNFLFKDVSNWISNLAKPYAEKSICSTYEGSNFNEKVYNFSYNLTLSIPINFDLIPFSHGKVATSVDEVGKMVLKGELYRYINWTKMRHIRMIKNCLQNYWRYPFVWGLWFLSNMCSVLNYVLVNLKLIRRQ